MLRRFNWRHIPLLMFTIFAIAPLVLIFSNSLKSKEEFGQNPLGLPKALNFANYAEAWTTGGYGQAFMNSLIVSIACIIIICFCASLAAYALAKIEFKFSNVIMAFLLLAMSIPMGLFLVPLFFIFQNLGLMDSLLGIIIIYSAIFLPFSIFLLRTFFVSIPNELLDSARIDGCDEFRVITKIVFPMAKPAFLTVMLLVALWTWNEFFFANAFLQTEELKTVATKYLAFTGRFGNDWRLISAAGVITVLPILVLFLFLQRQFIEGLTEGSIK